MTHRHVADIVRRKPVTLPCAATVQEACRLMHEHRIGAILVVDENQRLEGIFTGRDAVRLLAEGRNPAHTHLHAVMTQAPCCMAPHHVAMDALRLMQDGGFRHVPVVEDGHVLGLVSRGDFRAQEHARLDEETGFWERL